MYLILSYKNSGLKQFDAQTLEVKLFLYILHILHVLFHILCRVHGIA